MKTVEIQLETLTCPSCVKKLEGALAKTEGVKDAKVMFYSSKVKATLDENTTEKQVVDVINKLGFEVISSESY